MKRKNNRKWLWIGGGVALLVIVAVVIGVVVAQNNGAKNDNSSAGDENSEVKQLDSKTESDSKKDDSGDEKDFAEAEVEKKKVTQYEGEDPNKSEELTGVVTYTGVTDGVLMVRMSIDQYLTEGTCELILTRNGAIIYSDKADIVGDVSTAMCKGFDVPVADLGGGSVEVTINLSAGGRVGTIRGEADI